MNSKLSYYWWVYVLYAALVIAITLTVFHQLTLPSEDEKIQILFGGAGISSSQIENDLLTYLNENSTQQIKEVVFETVDSELSTFPEILVARAITVGDLVILPESAIRQNTGETYFMTLDEQKIQTIFGNEIDIYKENGIPYGIYLNSSGDENNFTSFLQENDPNVYVLFFNVFSLNTGDWNTDGNDEDRAAIESAIWLLEELNNNG